MMHDHYAKTYSSLYIRRLLDEWNNTAKGKQALQQAKATLNDAYTSGGYHGGNQSYISELQTLFIREVKDPVHSRVELTYKLEVACQVCASVLLEEYLFEGFWELLQVRDTTNDELHKGIFQKTVKYVTYRVFSLSGAYSQSMVVEIVF